MPQLLADQVVTPSGVLAPGLITIHGEHVVGCAAVLAGDPERPGIERVSGWVVPGFVDTHVHGGGGHDYATDDPEAALAARAFHAAHGTTTTVASLVTAPLETLLRQLAVLAELCADGHFAGIHLEGPFLSPDQRGAHDRHQLRDPDPATIEKLIKAGAGHVRMITVAPERPGAIEAIRTLTELGVTAAVGHTDGDRDAVSAGLDAGAKTATHLFNAMRSIHHRDPGPIPLLLDDPRVAVELIADGHHVHPDVLAMAAAAAGPDRVLLVTDAMVAAGMPDGAYSLGGLEAEVSGGVARLVGDDGPGPIAGSTATMAEAFAIMTAVTGDIAGVAAMAATNPARHLGLAGAGGIEIGRIEAGARADLCVVDDSGRLQRVMASGSWLAGGL